MDLIFDLLKNVVVEEASIPVKKEKVSKKKP
jgi:hypothetical protein